MATITTTPYYLDSAARTAGEAMTINGGQLYIRTDSRHHINAPASLTGSIGSETISATLGGGVYIDGTKVRWLEISGGSGTCAIGTTITQGGVSGYFLGYWASITSAPSTTIGATGFIKFREVTGGSFTDGALTGITATAVGADKVGWIEIVHDQAATLTVPRLGYHRARGNPEMFDLGVTTGVANQLVQMPTMGSSTCYSQGVWIETGVGTDVYEFYPSIAQALMTTANFGTTVSCKFVGMNTTGGVTIGGNGTAAVGYLPPAGCKIKTNNVFIRQCTTAARATTAIPHATVASRPEFATTSAGVIDHEYINCDWYYNLTQPSQVRLHYVSNFDTLVINECATALDLYEVHNNISASIDIAALSMSSDFAGGTIENCRLERYNAGSNDHPINISYCDGQLFKNVRGGVVQYARSSGKFQFTQCRNITIEECSSVNTNLALTTSFNCTVKNHDHIDRYYGTTNTTTAQYAIALSASCDNIVIDGVTFGSKGAIANVHPYSGVVYSLACSNVKVRNIGTREVPLNGGTANQPAYIFYDAGNNNTVKVQRCYMAPTRTGAIYTLNSSKNMLFEHVHGDRTDAHVQACLNATVRNIGATPTTTIQASVYGTHVSDYFTSDTAGAILFHFNEPTVETQAYVQTNFNGTSGFTSAGNVGLSTIGDYVQIETPYFIKGHTGFQNAVAVYTGTNTTTNHNFFYQIDTGSGWSAEKVFSQANIYAEVISPDVGFKMRFKVECKVANTGNLIGYVRFNTTSTLVAQRDNLYPLDTVTLTLSGLVSGSDVVILKAGTSTELANADAVGSTTYAYTYETPEAIDVVVYKRGYIPFAIRNYSLGSTNAGLLIAQVADRNYLE